MTKESIPDDKLRKLISNFNSPRLRHSDLESNDIFGNAFEYLREEFADETTNQGTISLHLRGRPSVLVELVQPKEGIRICDPQNVWLWWYAY